MLVWENEGNGPILGTISMFEEDTTVSGHDSLIILIVFSVEQKVSMLLVL